MGTGGATALGSPEGWGEVLGLSPKFWLWLWLSVFAWLTSEFLATRFALSLSVLSTQGVVFVNCSKNRRSALFEANLLL